MPSHSTWLHADEAIRIVQEGDNFRLQFGRGSDYDALSINRQHAEVLLANLHRLFGLSPAVVDAGNPLDAAYAAVNALGGWFDTSDAKAVGYDEALGHAMAEIERLGGKDPASRPSQEVMGRAA
jgi:hypothetical protein